MISDHIFARLQNLAVGRPPANDAADMPPEAYAAWSKGGLTFGKFVVLGELGRGGSSVVHRAWQAGSGREIALKVVTGLDPELRERFQREIRVASSLSHPGILPVFESGESGGSLWLSMPFVRGTTLDQCKFSPAEAALAIAAAARAVQVAHEAGVIHRDIKPRNLMKDASGVKVMDFGLAKTGGESTRLSVTGQILGTPQYMSPEQAAGNASDERTDVYGLGATLYRLLAGRPPYESETLTAFLQAIAATEPPLPSRAGRAVPAALETVVLKAMERVPERRYSTAAALADDLERFARGEPVAARRPSALVRWNRFFRRHRLELVAAGSLLLLAGVAAVGIGRSVFATPNVDRGGPKSPGTHESLSALEKSAMESDPDKEPNLAIDNFTRLLEVKPWDLNALLGRARCNVKLRRLNKADADLTNGLTMAPDHLDFLKLRSECRLLQEDFEGALADLDRALTLEPHSSEILIERAHVHLARNNLAAAIADASAAIKFDPDNAQAWASRARIWDNAGRLDQAIADYTEALRLRGPEAIWLMDRGRSKVGIRDGAGALADMHEAIKLDPTLAAGSQEYMETARQLLGDEKGPSPK